MKSKLVPSILCPTSKTIIVFLFILLLSFYGAKANYIKSQANSQKLPPGNFTGTVTNQTGQPLPGVTVQVKNSKLGTVTDADGNFTLHVPNDSLPITLVFKSVGYTSQEILAHNDEPLTISLVEGSSQLGDVVIIGYGTQSRTLLTTAISKLDPKVLENVPYANAASALEGTIPGLRVQSTSGQPGAAPRVILRGGTSINNPNGATPLYIIDGIIRDNMSNIAAEDIASLQVLKDAAATSIYGARGSNGVIIITTKIGEVGKTQITYSTSLTASKVGRTMQYASARDYIYYGRLSVQGAGQKDPAKLTRLTQADGFGTGNDLTNNTAYTTQYLTPDNAYKLKQGWESMPDPIDPSKTIIYKSTNYQDLLYRTGISQNHYISASGGSKDATFYLGAGYLEGQGTAISTNYRRFSLNLSGTIRVFDNLNVTGRILYSDTKDNAVASIANEFYRSASLPGTAKYQFEDGTIAPGQNSSIGNPKYFLVGPYARQGQDDDDELNVSLSANWKILPGLSFEPSFSMYKPRTDGYYFQPAYLNGVNNLVTTRNASASYTKMTQYQTDGVLTYVKSIKSKHNLEAKVGFSYYNRENYAQSGAGQGASTDLIPTLNASGLPTSVNGSISPLVIEGVFSRINYDYMGKYMVSLDARYDGASNLGQAYKFGFFPGISMGWNLDKEAFWKRIFPKENTFFKLRGSYGVNGNISGLSDFQSEGSYSVGNRYDNNPAIEASVIPNPNLKWEQSNTIDGGFDLGLLNGRLSLIFDYYNRITNNLLTTVNLPYSSGFPSVLTNLGSLRNNGIEADLSYQVFPVNAAFQWKVGFNIGTTKSKILKLPDNGIPNNRIGGNYVWDPATNAYAWLGGLQEGGRVGDMYAYQMIGVYATDEQASKGPYFTGVRVTDKTQYGGDAIFADLDHNDTIDTRDYKYLGNPYPTVTGGFSNTFTYKNFRLYIRTDFTLGHTIYNYAKLFADGQYQGDALPTKDYIEKMWKKQGDQASEPRYLWQDSQGNFLPSSLFYQKGDFLALREVTLSYTMPKKVLDRIKLKNLQFNLSGQNLHYFTAYSGPNPEEGGTDNGHYPIPVNIIFGVKVSL